MPRWEPRLLTGGGVSYGLSLGYWAPRGALEVHRLCLLLFGVWVSTAQDGWSFLLLPVTVPPTRHHILGFIS